MYGQGFLLTDPYLKVGKTNLIKYKTFSLTGELRAYAPISKPSHNSDRLTRFRSFSIANYDIPGTKFSLLSYNDISYYVFGSNGSSVAKNVALAVQPTLNYQALPTLGVYIGYEMDAAHYRNKGVDDWNGSGAGYGTYFYLGTSWDVTPKFNFSPYLQLRPGGAVNADSTELAAYLSYKFL
jgi:hypothetical protein